MPRVTSEPNWSYRVFKSGTRYAVNDRMTIEATEAQTRALLSHGVNVGESHLLTSGRILVVQSGQPQRYLERDGSWTRRSWHTWTEKADNAPLPLYVIETGDSGMVRWTHLIASGDVEDACEVIANRVSHPEEDPSVAYDVVWARWEDAVEEADRNGGTPESFFSMTRSAFTTNRYGLVRLEA